MPIQTCSIKGVSGFKWGNAGKCYTGPGAKQKAIKQGIAVEGKIHNARSKNPLRFDPTRTVTLRKAFEREFRKRLRILKGKILQLVYQEDVFGLAPKNSIRNSSSIENTRWQFQTNEQKRLLFIQWFNQEVSNTLVDVTKPSEDQWWAAYINQGFEKGVGRSFDDYTRSRLGLQQSEDFYLGSRSQFLADSFRQPVSIEKVKLLSGRVLSDLNGVTEAMSSQMSRVLVDGLIRGDNPRKVASDLNLIVDKIGQNRALTIARTETIRAHAEGQLQALEDLGVEELKVMVEWSTAEDDLVCPLCSSLQGIVIETSKATGMIPRHPSCRCAWLPANLGEDPKDQKRSKQEIEKAIEDSVDKESKKGTLEEKKAKTPWAGADATVPQNRPKSLMEPSTTKSETKPTQTQLPEKQKPTPSATVKPQTHPLTPTPKPSTGSKPIEQTPEVKSSPKIDTKTLTKGQKQQYKDLIADIRESEKLLKDVSFETFRDKWKHQHKSDTVEKSYEDWRSRLKTQIGKREDEIKQFSDKVKLEQKLQDQNPQTKPAKIPSVKPKIEPINYQVLSKADEDWYEYDNGVAMRMISRGDDMRNHIDSSGLPFQDSEITELRKLASELQKSASRSNTGKSELYRGEVLSKEELESRYQVGKTFKLDGLTASSPDPKIAAIYRDTENSFNPDGLSVEIIYKNPTGVKGHTRSDGLEVVLPHNDRYKVTGVIPKDDRIQVIMEAE